MDPRIEASNALEMARLLDSFQDRLTALEMARRSLDGGAVRIYDPVTGEPEINIGVLPDGTYGVIVFNPVAPPTPAPPVVNPTYGGITVAYFGQTADGSPWPMDLSHIEVHMSSLSDFQVTDGTLVNSFTNLRGGLYAAMNLDPGVTYYVRLVAVNTSGTESLPTAAVAAAPTSAVSQADLDALDDALQDAIDELSDSMVLQRGIFYNNVTNGDPVPDGPNEGDVWFKPDKGYSMFRFLGGAWTAALFDKDALAVGSVTAEKIGAGAVVAGKLAAGAVTAENLTVGSIGDNLIRNGNFSDLIGAAGTGPIGWAANTATAALSTTQVGADTYLKAVTPAAPDGQTVYQNVALGLIPARAGDQFHVELGAGSTGGAGLIKLVMHQYDATGVYIGTAASANLTTNNATNLSPSRNRVSAVLAIPAINTSVTGVRFGVTPVTPSTTYYFDKYTVGKVTVSARIADGAISAPKILAEAVITEKLAARAVRADKIEVGAITADHLSVSTKGFAVNANSNFEEELINSAGVPQGRPNGWSVDIGYGSNGATISYETANPISGARSAKVSLPANAGTRLYWDWSPPAPGPSGEISVQPGDKWFVSVRVRAVGGNNNGGALAELTMHTATPTQWVFDVFNPNVAWRGVPGATEIANGAEVTIAGNVTIDANSNQRKARLSLTLPARSTACYYVIDDFVCHPAVDDAQVTEIGAGKIVTGFIRAGQRIIAGASETGARTEMRDIGFLAYNSAGARTFSVEASNGEAIVGNPGSINISLSSYGAGWGPGAGGPAQGMIRFRMPGQGDGNIFSQYWSDSADHTRYGQGAHFAALRLQSPTRDGIGNPAYMDLRTTEWGQSRFHLEATQAHFTANTFVMGGPANTVDFRLGGAATGFTFTDFSTLSRLNLYADAGQFRLRSGNSSGAVTRMQFNGNPISMLFGGHNWEFHQSAAGTSGLHSFDRNVGIALQGQRVVVCTYNIDLHQSIEAASFIVVSDPRLKANAAEVTVEESNALEVMRQVKVYDYDMKGILPRVEQPQVLGPWPEGQTAPVEANRARGVMADELRELLPDAVHEDADGRLSVSLYDLLSTTIVALQAVDAEVVALKEQINPTTEEPTE